MGTKTSALRGQGRPASAIAIVAGLASLSACAGDVVLDQPEPFDESVYEWADFLDEVYQEPWEDGVFIVDGDTPVLDEKGLADLYSSIGSGAGLAVAQSRGIDARWSDAEKLNLTYCVSDTFGGQKAEMVAAMQSAAESWESVADLDFIYLSGEDGRCTSRNANVVFDVRPTEGQPYLARAFFPGQPRRTRNVIVDASSFFVRAPLSLTGILRHELGHALGFRHEHTRPGGASRCFEDNNYRGLTPYDPASTMHYPQCGGSDRSLSISPLDAEGASMLYGPPGGTTEPEPPSTTPEPPTGPVEPPAVTERSGSVTGTVAQGGVIRYQPLAVVPGTPIEVSMTGNGDADLYARYDQAPTERQFDCRPFRNGSAESCAGTVRAGVEELYLQVRGFRTSNFRIDVRWTTPATTNAFVSE